jgi:hypothetical protein
MRGDFQADSLSRVPLTRHAFALRASAGDLTPQAGRGNNNYSVGSGPL